MNRKTKTLGIALVAALSMSAVVVSGAQALNFTAASYPVTISGEQTAGKTHVLTYQGRPLTCEKVIYDPIGSYGGPTSSIKFAPTYNGCHAVILGNTLPATVTMNGCIYQFTAGGALTNNQIHIECSAGNKIQLHIYQDAAHKVEICTYEIGSQTASGVDLSNMEQDVTVRTTTGTLITMTRYLGELVPCGSASATATYVSEQTTVSGSNGGSPVKIDVG